MRTREILAAIIAGIAVILHFISFKLFFPCQPKSVRPVGPPTAFTSALLLNRSEPHEFLRVRLSEHNMLDLSDHLRKHNLVALREIDELFCRQSEKTFGIDVKIMLLTDFVSAFETNYAAEIYWKDLTALPLFTEIEWWQGSGDSINEITDINAINVIPSSDTKQGAGGTAEPVEATGIIGLICDRQAIGVGIQKMKAGSFYNPIDHYSNQSRSGTIQYFNDLTENGVVFIVEPTE